MLLSLVTIVIAIVSCVDRLQKAHIVKGYLERFQCHKHQLLLSISFFTLFFIFFDGVTLSFTVSHIHLTQKPFSFNPEPTLNYVKTF